MHIKASKCISIHWYWNWRDISLREYSQMFLIPAYFKKFCQYFCENFCCKFNSDLRRIWTKMIHSPNQFARLASIIQVAPSFSENHWDVICTCWTTKSDWQTKWIWKKFMNCFYVLQRFSTMLSFPDWDQIFFWTINLAFTEWHKSKMSW